ncbi:MAG TPA: hypothetical protein VFY72_06440 [Beijerinckiaceae bacterium]|nr:hypothetical protein [Beijerinckiaceae bacterium]
MSTGQYQQQRPPIDIATLAAALGSNVVPFVPPRDEPQPTNADWTEGLDLIDQAAAFLRSTEQRAQTAEERAEKVAFKAMEGLRTAQQRFELAEAQAREVERQAAEDIRIAQDRMNEAQRRMAEAETWAQAAEERARAAENRMEEAEGRLEAAEARARTAEEWLRCLTESLTQKLTFTAPAAPVEEVRPAPRRRAG